MIGFAQVSGLVLAGGEGRRMQARPGETFEKGLALLHGRPLVAWAARRLPSGLARVYISANRHAADYAAYGTVLADAPQWGPGWGPLAGVATALQHMATDWLLVVPADVPQPPCMLSKRLLQCINASDAQLVYARTHRPQPLFMLVHRSQLESLQTYLQGGGRRAVHWVQAQGHALQVRENKGNKSSFFNVNTQEELCLAHQLITPAQA